MADAFESFVRSDERKKTINKILSALKTNFCETPGEYRFLKQVIMGIFDSNKKDGGN